MALTTKCLYLQLTRKSWLCEYCHLHVRERRRPKNGECPPASGNTLLKQQYRKWLSTGSQETERGAGKDSVVAQDGHKNGSDFGIAEIWNRGRLQVKLLPSDCAQSSKAAAIEKGSSRSADQYFDGICDSEDAKNQDRQTFRGYPRSSSSPVTASAFAMQELDKNSATRTNRDTRRILVRFQ